MTKQLIINKLFKSVINERNGLSTERTAAILFKYGIVLSKPARLTQNTIDDLLDLYGINLFQANSTFYKTVQERAEKDGWEVAIDRILLYASTYGARSLDNPFDDPYEPTPIDQKLLDCVNSPDFKANPLTYLTVNNSAKDLETIIFNLLTTVTTIPSKDAIELLDFMHHNNLEFPDYENVQSNEIKVLLATKYNIVPTTPFEFVRAFNYIITESPLLIKNRETNNAYETTINAIKFSSYELETLNKLVTIATLFNNYYDKYHHFAHLGQEYRHHKYYYLNLRRVAQNIKEWLSSNNYLSPKIQPFHVESCTDIVRAINKIKRESDKHHTPQKPSNIFTDNSDVTQLAKDLSVASLIKLYNATRERLYTLSNNQPEYKLYHIRNGKSFIKQNNRPVNESRLREIERVLRDELIRKTSKRFGNIKVLLSKGVHYAAPTSGKQFIQNMPFFSYVDLDQLGVNDIANVGISWNYNADLDLHAQSNSGHVGYYAETISGVQHSGDMVTLNNYGYAAEYLTIYRHQLDESLAIAIANYDTSRSVADKTCKFIVADAKHKYDRQYIIAPDAIKFALTFETTDIRNINICYLIDNKLIFTNFSFTGNVPNEDDMRVVLDIIKHKQKQQLSLEELFELAGAEIIYDEADVDDPDSVLDLRVEYTSQSDMLDLVNFK